MSDQSIAAICTTATIAFTVVMNVVNIIVSKRNGRKLNQVKHLLNGHPKLKPTLPPKPPS